MSLEIRLSTRADLSDVDALFARAYPRLLRDDYPPSVLVTALPIISRAQPDLLVSERFFVGTLEGAIVTAGGWSQGAPGTGRGMHGVGHVRHVVSDPDHVRKGYGRALMERVMWHAKGSGMGVLQCQSTRTAVPFYQSLGFVAQGEIDVPLRQGIHFPAVKMVAPL